MMTADHPADGLLESDRLRELDGLLEPIAESTLSRLHARLEAEADKRELLDVAVSTIDSPVGRILLAATEIGLVRVAFAIEDHDVVLESLAARVSPRIVRAPSRLESATRQIDDYFAGARQQFEVPLDWQLSRGFRRQVLEHLNQIGYGHTESYAAVAAAAGSPRAVRAVGSACATNPLPIVVPCHRVLRSDGALGGYLGGLEAKRILLGLEGAA
nr:methylated-DNA--[protein]-cysteine S-methyltransferase [Salinibacterium hongtaonis]